jgi:hypothetical protein
VGFTGGKVGQAERAEVADKHKARHVGVGQGVKIVESLLFRAEKVAPEGFLFDDQGPGPEQVDAALGAVDPFGGAFVGGDPFAVDVEDAEEVVVEGLGVGDFVAIIGMIGSEGFCAGADFGPGQSHAGVVA